MNYDFINDYVGAEFQQNGRGPAFDCYGLVCDVFKKQREIILPDWVVTNPRPSAAWSALTAGIADQCALKNIEEVEPPYLDFDIPVISRGHLSAHMGVVLNRGVLHCSIETRGAVWCPFKQFANTIPGAVRVFRWRE